jgi:predicted PurR-regulated permease PerM
MARIVSFVVLVAILLLVGGVFIKVMAGFLLPLFLALLLVVMFGPLERWYCARLPSHPRVAAAATTASILLVVLVPLLGLLAAAGFEAQSVYHAAMESRTAGGEDGEPLPRDLAALADWAATKIAAAAKRLGVEVDPQELLANFSKAARQFLAPLALRTTQLLGGTLLGLFVMILATYYFFADGPAMLQAIRRLSPLETEHTQTLLAQFGELTRAVVAATLLSALVQGLLAGVGYYFAGLGGVFLLTALSMLFTLVPFIGAAIVWVPACLWLYAIEGRTLPAVLLAVWCAAVVSTADNLIKPWVLQGRSNLHPLLALLSVLGGVEALGPIGILVGPMVVAFLQTLLGMVHTELASISESPTASPLSRLRERGRG